MIMQIGLGIFVGFLLICAFCLLILAVAYVFGKKQENVPSFMKEPEKANKRAYKRKDFFDDYEDR